MKKLPIVIGFIFIFAGVIMMPSSNLNYEKTVIDWAEAEAEIKENSWNITWFFTKGDLFKAEVHPAMDWSNQLEPPTSEVPYDSKGVFVNISDPSGQMTEFFCVYVLSGSSSVLRLYDVKVTESHGLLVGANASLRKEDGIAGEALTTGNYTVWTWAVLPGASQSAPTAMVLVKGEKGKKIEYPYSNLIYIGAVAIPLGAVLLIYGFKKRRKVKHIERKAKKMRYFKK